MDLPQPCVSWLCSFIHFSAFSTEFAYSFDKLRKLAHHMVSGTSDHPPSSFCILIHLSAIFLKRTLLGLTPLSFNNNANLHIRVSSISFCRKSLIIWLKAIIPC